MVKFVYFGLHCAKTELSFLMNQKREDERARIELGT